MSGSTALSKAEVEQAAYLKLMLHTAKYPWAQVSGFLLGDERTGDSDNVVVKDAVPLFHTSTLAPLLETAATMVDAHASKKGLAIVGFYQAQQRADDNSPGVLANKIMEKIDSGHTGSSVLLLVSGKKLEVAGEHTLSGYGKDNGSSFRRHIEVAVSAEAVESFDDLLSRRAETGIVDMDEHFDDEDGLRRSTLNLTSSSTRSTALQGRVELLAVASRMEETKSKRICCFAVEVFDDNQFDPSAFVASTRSLVPLERLRDDLQGHLSDRKQELYDLINRDYADFILVSSKLSGVGAKVADLRDPMSRLLSRASGLRSAAEIEASRLEAKLEERRAIRERKQSIHRCLRFLSTLDTAERILAITTDRADEEEDDEGEGSDSSLSKTSANRHEGVTRHGTADRSRWDAEEDDEGFDDPDLLAAFPGLSAVGATAARTKREGEKSAADGAADQGDDLRAEAECALLERVAHYALMMNADLQAATEEEASGAGDNEATSLLKSMSSRASRVESEITRRLRSEFAGLVNPQQQGATASSTCALASAAGVDMPFGGRIAAAGEEAGAARERKRRAMLSCLRPFSALGSGMEAEKQFVRAVMQPFLDARLTPGILDAGERGSCKGLGPLLDELLEYVKQAAGDALDAAEEMLGTPSASEEPKALAEDKIKESDDVNGMRGAAPLPVDLVCNGVWRPVQQVLMTRLSSIFATGMASAQHTNYTQCMEFLEGLSGICGEGKRAQVRARLLAQPSVGEFKARWNLPIYFQLRSRKISARLEAALSTATGRGYEEGEEGTAYGGPEFELPEFREAWSCLSLCWDREVFLPSLAHRFLRLTLQGIGRIGAWAGSADVLGLSPDDIVPVASDLDRLLIELQNDFVNIAAKRLSARAPGERHRAGRGALEESDARELLSDSIREAVGGWGVIVGQLWDKATSQVAEQCTAMLQAVKGITATYRMTNKPAPQRPSPFVPNVLRALREFDRKWGACASSKDAAGVAVANEKGGGDSKTGSGAGSWKQRVVLAVCSRYLEIVSELLLTVRQMENTLNKRRVTARRGSRPGGGDQGPSDKDKIMMQLRLDVAEFGREAAQLGVDLSATDVYRRLLEVVEASGEESATAGR